MSAPSLFCPSSADLCLKHLSATAELITLTATGRRPTVPCPACGTPATRVQSRYRRTLADLPWQGVRVVLHVTVRRFFCDAPGCPRRIFAEPLPATTTRYARRTSRAAALLETLGFALGGRPAARLGAVLGVTSAPTTVLRALRAAAVAEAPTPRVLGVDDWALRRGQRYGTVLVDLERRRVVDLLPDREAATLAAWLTAHPGVEIVSRDRGGSYAEGTRVGAPEAIQVADRFHLVHNLVDALERICTKEHAALREAARVVGPLDERAPQARRAAARQRRTSELPNNRAGPTTVEQRSTERRARRVARYEEVVALAAQGLPKKQIARRTGLNRRTVITWLAAGHFPERASRGRPVPSATDGVADQIAAYYDQGGRNAAALARELTAAGYPGSVQSVRRALQRLRQHRPPATVMSAPPARPPVQVPSARTVAWLLRAPEEPEEADVRRYLHTLLAQCPVLREARTLARRFGTMLTTRDVNALAPWLADAEESALRSFARGLRRDHDAVLAALCFPWNNGQAEGQIHRIKLLKRSMYGRASFPLLRARVLHAA